jgi:hypothetical protein
MAAIDFAVVSLETNYAVPNQPLCRRSVRKHAARDGANLAIYELDGDQLKICYDLTGKSRPKEFSTKDAKQLFLVNYKRAKP